MKLSLALSLMLATLCTTSIARAEWTGTQLLLVGGIGNEKLSDDGSIAGRASVHQFLQPATGTRLTFVYAGPRFNISDMLWFAPQTGSAMGWAPDGGDAAIASIWIGVSPMERVSLFFESDLYFYDGDYDYYGLYTAEYAISKPLAVGAMVEQVNTDLVLGPSATLYTQAGPWVTAQYVVVAQEQFAHTMRFVVGLVF